MDHFLRLAAVSPSPADALRAELAHLQRVLAGRRRHRRWLGLAAALLSVFSWVELRLGHSHVAAWSWLAVAIVWLTVFARERSVGRRCERLSWRLMTEGQA